MMSRFCPPFAVRQCISGTATSLLVWLVVASSTACAQGEWISRMDDDGNGFIEPDELSDRGREYLLQFTRPYGIKLTRPNSVRILEEAAKRYRARRDNASNAAQQFSAENGIRGFNTDREAPVIPGFGISEIPFPYSQSDLERAQRSLDRSDQNDDGILDTQEIAAADWNDRDPWENDLNHDRKLNILELAQRYAKRRLLEERAALMPPTTQDSQANQSGAENGVDRRAAFEQSFRASRAGQSFNGDRGSRSLAESIVERYDFDRNNLLDPNEMTSVGFSIPQLDLNRDGRADRDELAKFLAEESETSAAQSQEFIPTWFFEKDMDRDGQVAMSEFSAEWSPEKIAEFDSYDLNHDGIITSTEILESKTVVGGRFNNQQAQILIPRSTILSEIVVDEDYLIGDLNVQLSITHTSVGLLDGYLIGPDGEQIELFTGVGGSDDHFNKTIFDDDAGMSIARARPPFEGSFQPEAIERRGQSLNRYRGKNLKGTWQLMIRGSRSERAGILHGWSLIVQPNREAVDELGGASKALQPESPLTTVQ